MPFYELFALARPALQRGEQYEIIRTAATAVLSGGGVLADIKSYGERPTAYPIRPPGNRYDSAYMWQLGFKAAPSALPQLEHGLKVDERVLRYILMKREIFQRMPTTHKVAKLAASNIHLEQEQRLQAAREQGKALWWDPERNQAGNFRFTDPATGQDVLLRHSSPRPDPSQWLTSSIDDQRSVWQETQEGSDAREDSRADSDPQDIATELSQADAGAFPNPPQIEQEAEESSKTSPQPNAVKPDSS